MKKDFTDYFKDFEESLGNKASTREQLEKELARIESEYRSAVEPIAPDMPELPETPSYEKLEYDAPSDEKIAENAESSLSDYKKSGVESIESQTEAAKKAKEEERLAVEAAAQKRAQAVAEGYEEATRTFENDALKRGLARSSIAANKSAGLASAKAEALAESAAAAENATKKIEGEISSLEISREKALDSFNIAYAAKLTEKIAELTTERDKKQAEVVKYNNTLLELERKAANERAELESKLKSKSESQAKPSVDPETALSVRNESAYNVVRSYLSGMSKAQAAEAVRSDPVVRDALSDYYYYKIYNEYIN